MSIDVFNLVEGAFWIGLGAWVLLTRRMVRGRRQVALAVLLMAFGVSDFVEMRTGAWWTPWWLLVWKIVCVGVFIHYFIHLERRRP
ncbi:MAG: hypothetical protein GXY41_10465 [Phycisphaerae bacterium]|nr:hypothetical protein [Phycisphaerae bacterium]